MRPRNTIARIFAWPAAIALASAAGLAAGLAGDVAWDWVAWAGLAAPLLPLVTRRRARTCDDRAPPVGLPSPPL